MSQVPLKKVEPNEKRLEWKPFTMSNLPENMAELIGTVLERNGVQLTVRRTPFSLFIVYPNPASIQVPGIRSSAIFLLKPEKRTELCRNQN